MGVVWSMLEVSNWEEERCPDRSNRPPVVSKNAAATAAVPKNTADNNAIIKNVKNTNTKNTKNAKNAKNAKNTNVPHAAAARRASNTTAGV
jgi:hypothetical protein